MSLMEPHCGYRSLKSFQIAQLVYDLTVRFCNRFISKFSRTHDQMVQAARSGVQNIAEGSQASATSKKNEIKLTNVALASLVELLQDYEDFLRQRNLPLWQRSDVRRQELISSRFETADQVVLWVKDTATRYQISSEEVAANALHALISVASELLRRQIQAQMQAFEREGGFTERLYHIRKRQPKPFPGAHNGQDARCSGISS